MAGTRRAESDAKDGKQRSFPLVLQVENGPGHCLDTLSTAGQIVDIGECELSHSVTERLFLFFWNTSKRIQVHSHLCQPSSHRGQKHFECNIPVLLRGKRLFISLSSVSLLGISQDSKQEVTLNSHPLASSITALSITANGPESVEDFSIYPLKQKQATSRVGD